MRAVVTCLFLLLALCGSSSAVPLQKSIKIYNNTANRIFPIINLGAETGQDSWLMALFQVKNPNQKYIRFNVNRVYVTDANGNLGIAANDSVEIAVPFFTQLVAGDPINLGFQPDEFITWWNGGRVIIYDVEAEVRANLKNDQAFPINPSDPGVPVPCVVTPTDCKRQQVYFRDTKLPNAGLPDTDRSQLMEYTFANAITPPDNKLPYKLTDGVGYNISSVDQVYLPVAMQPSDNPVPYIGTTQPVGAVQPPTGFRGALKKWLLANPGWPVYNNTCLTPPNCSPVPDPLTPRVPAAQTLFPNAFDGSKLFYFGNPEVKIAVNKLKTLYETCNTNPDSSDLCKQYSQIIAFLNKNFALYIQNFKAKSQGGCRTIETASPTELQMLQKIYGWVPFNEGCGFVNALKDTAAALNPPKNFTKDIETPIYIKALQESGADGGQFQFNPFVNLIHGSSYLNMPNAYAFSVDDAVGFQSYPGGGIIITVGGATGLINNTPLDPKNKVTVSLGNNPYQLTAWLSANLCGKVDLQLPGPGFDFFPGAGLFTYPCPVTVTDLQQRPYQFTLTAGPPPGTTKPTLQACDSGSPSFRWCNAIQPGNIEQRDGKWIISTQPPFPDPPTSSHDLNGDGNSDILWRLVSPGQGNGTVATWLMIGQGIIFSIGDSVGNVLDPSVWSIVSQRDFNRDGRADLLWRDSAGDTAVWFLDGNKVVGSQVFPTTPCTFNDQGVCVPTASCGPDPKCVPWAPRPANWEVAATGQSNANPNFDTNAFIFWRDKNTGAVEVWLMATGIPDTNLKILNPNGVGCLDLKTNLPCPARPTSWSVVGAADFDADGFTDILWQDSSGNIEIWFMQGLNLLAKSGPVGCCAGSPWRAVGVGNFVGGVDKHADILFRATPGDWAIWRMGNDLVPVEKKGFLPVDTKWSIELVGDYNFDGKSDILWRYSNPGNPNDPSNGAVAIYFMNGLQEPPPPDKVGLGIMNPLWKLQRLNAE